MGRVRELILVLVVIAVTGFLFQRRPASPSRYNVPLTLELAGVPRNEVLKAVAEEMGVRVHGSVKGDYLDDYRWDNELAFNVLDELAYDGWKLIGGVLLLMEVEHAEYPDTCRQEFILEHLKAGEILSTLRGTYPRIRFLEHPTMNGFYVLGPKADILHLKRALPYIDHENPEDFPPHELRLKLNHLTATEAEVIVKSFPGLGWKFDDGQVSLTGPVEQVGLAYQELYREDALRIDIAVSCSELLAAPPTCGLRRFYSSLSVDCEKGCAGPLHLLGLERGDEIGALRNEGLRGYPEWWMVRDGVRYHLVLHPH